MIDGSNFVLLPFFIYEKNGEEFNELFYEGLEDFIIEKVNLQFCI